MILNIKNFESIKLDSDKKNLDKLIDDVDKKDSNGDKL